MEHKIVISGEGSAHPKLGVKKKNSVEENLKILNEMIESGTLSLDHAIAKPRPGGSTVKADLYSLKILASPSVRLATRSASLTDL